MKGDESRPNVDALRNLARLEVSLEGETWGGISVRWSHSMLEPYLFACAVSDRVQLAHESLATAVDVALSSMHELLRRESRLSEEQEVGLIGELVTVLALMKTHGVRAAVNGWLGSKQEEHDIALPDVDLEVKTTTSESRVHWISSLRQLVPVEKRPLRLVSIQLTPKIGDGAVTLPHLAEHVVTSAEELGSDVIEKMRRVGYNSEDRSLYVVGWALRGEILEYEVGGDFPRITPDELERMGENAENIVEVRYRIQLDGREPAVNPITHFPENLSLR